MKISKVITGLLVALLLICNAYAIVYRDFASRNFDRGTYIWTGWHNSSLVLHGEFQDYNKNSGFNTSGLLALWHMNNVTNEVKDSSGKGNDGLAYKTYPVKGKLRDALRFNGFNSYVAIKGLFYNRSGQIEDFSFGGWIKNDHIIDDFDGKNGDPPNSKLWTIQSGLAACEIRNNWLYFNNPHQSGSRGLILKSFIIPQGTDFTVEISYKGVGDNENGWDDGFSILLRNMDQTRTITELKVRSTIISPYAFLNGKWYSWHDYSKPEKKGRIKIVKQGSTYYYYRDPGTGSWQFLRSLNFRDYRTRIELRSYSTDGDMDYYLDNFSLKFDNPEIIASWDRSSAYRLTVGDDSLGGYQGNIGFDTTSENGTIHDLKSSSKVNDGKWHFITVTYNHINGTKRIYIDGQLDTEVQAYPPGRRLVGGSDLPRYGFLGAGSEAGVFNGSISPPFFFGGSLDEITIWNRTLSCEEVKEIYNAQRNMLPLNGSFTSRVFSARKPVKWLEADFYYDSILKQTNTINHLPDYQATQDGINMSGNVILYHFDKNRNDYSGNNKMFDFYNGAGFLTNSSTHNAVWLDGVNDYIRISPNLNDYLLNETLTVSIWFKPQSSGILLLERGLGGWHNSQIELLSNGILKGRVWGLSPINIGNVTFGRMHNVVLRYDKSNLTLTGFLDGVKSQDYSTGDRSSPDSLYYHIGCADSQNLGDGSYFGGVIDELAIWNRALSDEEIKKVYQSGFKKGLNITIRSCNLPDCSDRGNNWDLMCNASLCNLSTLPTSRYLQYTVSMKSDYEISPVLYAVKIKNNDSFPLYQTFSSNPLTTNLSDVQNLSNVSNLMLCNDYGCINFTGVVNTRNQNFDDNIMIGKCFVSVDSAYLDSSLNSSALITFNFLNGSCGDNKIYKTSGFYEDAESIRRENLACGECSLIRQSNSSVTFYVPHFTSYALGSNTMLYTFNNRGNRPQQAGSEVVFYANYTDRYGNYVDGANCVIRFDSSPDEFVMSRVNNLFTYTKIFNVPGIHLYNITCSKPGSAYNTLYRLGNKTVVPRIITLLNRTLHIGKNRKFLVQLNATDKNITQRHNLTISLLSNTTFSEVNLDNLTTVNDITLLNIDCGGKPVYRHDNYTFNKNIFYILNNNSLVPADSPVFSSGQSLAIKAILLRNYNCSNISYITFKPMTYGVQRLNFTFGDFSEEFTNKNLFVCDSCDACMNATAYGGDYAKVILSKNISSSGDCMTIQSGKLVLDCKSHAIRGSGTGTALRISDSDISVNITVQNCTVDHYYDSIYIEDAANITLSDLNIINSVHTPVWFIKGQQNTMKNSILRNNHNGLRIQGTKYFRALHNQIINTTNDAITIEYLGGHEMYAYIANNYIEDSSNGIYQLQVGYSEITNNTLTGQKLNCIQIDPGIMPGYSTANKVWKNTCNSKGILDPQNNTDLCVNNTGNFYGLNVADSLIPDHDCGPYSVVYVDSSRPDRINWGRNATFSTLSKAARHVMSNMKVIILPGSGLYSGSFDFVTAGRHNVSINCNNNTLQGSGMSVAFNLSNIHSLTLQNCTIKDYETGILLNKVSNSSIIQNIFDSNINTGLYINSDSHNNIIRSNKFYGSGITDYGCNNYCHGWGNYYNRNVDPTQILTSDCGPTPNKLHYSVNTSAATYIIWGENATYASLAELSNNVPSGALITLAKTFDSYNESLSLPKSNITLDCRGAVIHGNQEQYGIYVTAPHVKINNCTLENFLNGIYVRFADDVYLLNNHITLTFLHALNIYNSDNLNISDNNISGNEGDAVYIAFSENSSIIGNDIQNNTKTGIMLYQSNSKNTIKENTLKHNHCNLELYDNSNIANNITNNTFIGVCAFNITGSGNIIWNNDFVNYTYLHNTGHNNFNYSSTGNYWTAYDSQPEGCKDNNEDDICDAPYHFVNGVDYYPSLYSMKNLPPKFVLKIPSKRWLSDGQGVQINLSQHFISNRPIIFSFIKGEGVDILINQTTSIATISNQPGFVGKSYVIFIANNSRGVTSSNNITLESISSAEAKPDLLVQSYYIENPFVDANSTFFIDLKNQGYHDADAFVTYVYFDDKLIGNKTITCLQKLQNITIAIPITFNTGGKHSLRVVVDPTDFLFEENESNNELISDPYIYLIDLEPVINTNPFFVLNKTYNLKFMYLLNFNGTLGKNKVNLYNIPINISINSETHLERINFSTKHLAVAVPYNITISSPSPVELNSAIDLLNQVKENNESNNRLSLIRQIKKMDILGNLMLPLIVSEGQTANIIMDLYSDLSLNNLHVKLFIENSSMKHLVDGFMVNLTKDTNERIIKPYLFGSSGNYTIRMLIDTDNMFNERDESNNNISRAIRVLSAACNITSIQVPHFVKYRDDFVVRVLYNSSFQGNISLSLPENFNSYNPLIAQITPNRRGVINWVLKAVKPTDGKSLNLTIVCDKHKQTLTSENIKVVGRGVMLEKLYKGSINLNNNHKIHLRYNLTNWGIYTMDDRLHVRLSYESGVPLRAFKG